MLIKKVAIDLALHPKQKLALKSTAKEIVYGGAAGGGKSHLARVFLIKWCTQVKNLQAYLFRREYDDLIRTHVDGAGGFRVLLQPFVDAKLVQIVEGEIRFLFNGSKIHLCHCHEERDVYRYLSLLS